MRVVWILLLLGSCKAYSLGWVDFWSTKDQQAQVLMNQGEFKQAETIFLQPDWRAAAAYRAGNYQQAAKQYQALKNEPGYYNQGNALAHLGQYELAIKAYDRALALNPDNKDAAYNRKILIDLLKENKNQKNQQGKDKQDQNQQGKDKQDQNQQGKDKQDQNKQGKDQQDQNQQDKDKQDQNKTGKDQLKQNKQDSEQSKQQKKANKNNEKPTDEGKSPEELEKQQAKEQWLRLIPDDPAGLMREKFLRDHLRREGGWYQ